LARRLGAKEQWLVAVRRETPETDAVGPGSEDGLEGGWKAALRYAELVTESGHSVSDADYAELAKYWDDGELIELTLVVGLFSYFNRFNDALRVEITR
jgi:alkylhydroperoxidase family enzyme